MRASPHHNNARLRAFLDGFGFEYEFKSATELYKSGAFDAMLLRALERYDAIMKIMLPTLGRRSAQDLQPLPADLAEERTRALRADEEHRRQPTAPITFDDEDGEEITQTVTGGHAKMQWKPDFGMRWAALGVDFEMFGKDHQPNQPVYAKICQALGVEPPVNFVYELFLDQHGEKISKSKGNGISIEQWLTLRRAREPFALQFPKAEDGQEALFRRHPEGGGRISLLRRRLSEAKRSRAAGKPGVAYPCRPSARTNASPISFALLMNLVSAANAETKDQLWAFIAQVRARRDAADASRSSTR